MSRKNRSPSVRLTCAGGQVPKVEVFGENFISRPDPEGGLEFQFVADVEDVAGGIVFIVGGLEFQFVADVEDVAGGIVFIVAIRPLIDVADVQRTSCFIQSISASHHREQKGAC